MTIVHGTCDARFARLRAAFERNFVEDGEVGAAVSVTLDGKTVVDLWGGHRDAARTRPWARDTIVCMMSVAKAVSALCVHMLIDEGRIELDAPIARYWPEFAQNGKETIPVRWILCHLAGVPVADAAGRGDMYDWTAMTRAIAAQAPLWAPGSTRCYHSATRDSCSANSYAGRRDSVSAGSCVNASRCPSASTTRSASTTPRSSAAPT